MKRFISFLICLVFSFSVFVGTVVRADAAVIDASALFLSKSALTYAEATGMNVLASGMSAAEVGAAFSSSAVSAFAAEQGVTEAALAAQVGAGITITPKAILITAAAAAILGGIVYYCISHNSNLEQVNTPVVLSSSTYFTLNDGSKFPYAIPIIPTSDRSFLAFDSLPVNSIDISHLIDLVVNYQNHSGFWSNVSIGNASYSYGYYGAPVWSTDDFEIVPIFYHWLIDFDQYELRFIFRYKSNHSYQYGASVASNDSYNRVNRPDSIHVNNHFIIPFFNSSYNFLGFAFPAAYTGNYSFLCYNSHYYRSQTYSNLYNFIDSGSSSGISSLSLSRSESFELPSFDDADNIRITIPDTSTVELNPNASPDTVLDPIIDGVFSEQIAERPELSLDVVSEPSIVEPDIPSDTTLPFLPAISTPWHYVVDLLEDISDFIGVWVLTFTSVLPEPFVNCFYAAVVLLVTFGIIMRFL